ncbi:MAG TPA: TadE family type IV pilus minor pilin [Pseudonocardiaceae bacterium]|jgi:Flp pilus assembly protein TadG|nr:TadE family type IV pilus minor pilin [Pseudonocardiaceae bacterium]
MGATSRAAPPAAHRKAGWLTGDDGMVTVESAIALCAFVTVLVMVLAGTSAVLAEIRCTDAAREAARLVARGDTDGARQAVARIAPSGATYTVDTQGPAVSVVVTARPAGSLLPGVRVNAQAYAVREPDAADDFPSTSGPPPPPPRPTEGSAR